MTTKNDDKAAALAAYNSVVADAELDDIYLISCSFFVKPEYYQLTRSGENSAKVKRSFDSNFVMFSYDPENKLLGGQFDWVVDATHGRKKLLQVKASYVISYENVPEVENVHIQAFIKRVGKFATYPYFRNLVSQYSWESRTDLPVMPVLK